MLCLVLCLVMCLGWPVMARCITAVVFESRFRGTIISWQCGCGFGVVSFYIRYSVGNV